eukprot:TRINITY_DN2151_c6_g1_i1.p1 TRINITY_DN2151_c6_g1~~TRINITY_DN2151_c6_g1_i1.p1  ORF type:complete len:578 (+),score=142.46 TRINITY_DN2151_c6_g1_i1:40-1773(+)
MSNYGTLKSEDGELMKPPTKFNDEDELLLGDDEDVLPFSEKLAFAAGALVNAISTSTTGFYLNPFLLEVAAFSPSSVSLMMFLGRAWDAVTTACVGALVAKFPNLRMWLLIGTIPTCAVYVAVWLVPFEKNESEELRFAYSFGMYLLFQLGTSAYHVPYTALTVRMHHNAKQRDIATTWRMLAEILSVLFGAGLQGMVLAFYNANDDCRPCDNSSSNNDAENAYMVSGIIMGSVMLVGGIACPLGVVERVKEMPSEKDELTLKESLKMAFMSRSFVTLTGAFFFIWLTVQGVQGNIMLYAKYSQDKWNDSFQYLLGALVFCATIGMPIWMIIMKHIGKKYAYILGASLLAPMLFLMFAIPSYTEVWIGAIMCVMAGFFLAAAYLLPWAMLPAVVDEAELKTGRRAEAIFYAFFVFFMKMGAGVALAGSALALQAAGWEDPCCKNVEGQICDCSNQNATCICDANTTNDVSDALKYVIGLAGPALICLGIVCAFMFPIDAKRELEIAEEMTAMRAVNPEESKRQSYVSNHVGLRASYREASLRNSEDDNNLTRRHSAPATKNPLTALQQSRPKSMNIV